MNTGTPLDLTPFGVVLTGMGFIYWTLALGALLLALFKPKRGKDKAFWVGLTVVAFGFLPATEAWPRYKAQQKLNVATARFEERCKTAGEKIYRTVKDVEGILLMKVRPAVPPGADSDPMWPGAALFSESTQEEFIESFLFYEFRGRGFEHQRGNISYSPSQWPGYRYVDVVDETDGKRYRYTASLQALSEKLPELVLKLKREVASGSMPLYGVTYEDIVDAEDRQHWIAGTTLQIIELASGQIVAEQIRYLMDSGLGSKSGARSPWGWASSYGKECPKTSGNLASQTRFFVDQVLKSKKGE